MTHQPGCNGSRGGAHSGNEHTTRQRLAVRPGKERAPQTIRLVECQTEYRDHETRYHSHEER